MIYLFIDTSTNHLCVSILNNEKELYRFNEIIEKDMASQILPAINDALKQVNINLNDIDKIFVVNGPGSFTGIRVGVTVAKTIAWCLKKEIIPISSLEVLATTQVTTKYCIPMIDARRGNVFAGIYDEHLNIIEKDKLVNKDNLLIDKDSNYTIISYDFDEIKPSINPMKIIIKHRQDKSINPHYLIPSYLKMTEAEENLKK